MPVIAIACIIVRSMRSSLASPLLLAGGFAALGYGLTVRKGVVTATVSSALVTFIGVVLTAWLVSRGPEEYPGHAAIRMNLAMSGLGFMVLAATLTAGLFGWWSSRRPEASKPVATALGVGLTTAFLCFLIGIARSVH